MGRIFLVFCILIIFSSFSYSQKKEKGLTSILEENGYDGVILLYDYNSDRFFASHLNKSDERVLPASTFKIFNTLMLLDLEIVQDTSFVLPWDGQEEKHKGIKVPRWYKDTNLAEAFRNSTVWYYRTLSKSIPFATYKSFMKKNKYGKVYGRDKGELDFWNKGSKIGVSVKDQIIFLIKLKDYGLTFKKDHIDMVKNMMIQKQTKDYVLRGKTGWTESPSSRLKKGIDLGWYVGYVEYSENSYFFAIRLEKEVEDKRDSFAKDRITIAKEALKVQFGLDLQ